MPLEHVTLIDTEGELGPALAGLADLDVVGVDVERSDWDRYYRAAALIQVGGAGSVVLVDPLVIGDLRPLQVFLSARRTVLHACENDLGPLATLGIDPPSVEDTSLAAAILGLPMGLETLLSELLGVDLVGDKAAMQRADWEARPLTDTMQTYAAGDVADLPALWRELERRLVEAGRVSWYREELAAVLAQPSVEARRAWTRTKGVGRLGARAQTRLRALWEMRERLGRDTDTAPGRIASDKVLLDLASTPPTRVAELGRRGVRRQAVHRFGAQLLSAVAEGEAPADAGGRDGRPAGRAGRAPTEEDRAMVDRLRALRSQRARELGIDPGVLCPNRMLMGAVLADPGSSDELRDALGLRTWQWEQLGAAFSDALELERRGSLLVRPTSEETPVMADVLNPDALHHGLDTLDGWTGTIDGIAKTYTFADFAASMRFVNQVAELAEGANHHPDIHVSWNTVVLQLVTHSAGGVTQADLDMAEQIDELPAPS